MQTTMQNRLLVPDTALQVVPKCQPETRELHLQKSYFNYLIKQKQPAL